MSWKDVASRTVAGPKHTMSSIPGYWFKPRKFSVTAADDINAESMRSAGTVPTKIKTKMAKLMKENPDLDEGDLIAELTDEEIAELTDVQGRPASDLIRLRIKHGVAEHNYEGPDENGSEVVKSGLTDEQVAEILQFPEVAKEMVEAIMRWNRPLAHATSGISETSQSGATEEPSS